MEYPYASPATPAPPGLRPPPPSTGREQCLRYPGESRAGGAALTSVSWRRGRASPDPVLPSLSRYTGPWWLSPQGVGTGEGVSLSPQGDTHTFLSGNPTPPALRAPPPPPPGGEGSHGDTRWEAVPGIVLAAVSRKGGQKRTGSSRFDPGNSPWSGPWRYRHGEGAGAVMAISGGKPYPVLLRDLPGPTYLPLPDRMMV